MERLERQLVESTLRRCQYHKERAAKELGLARSSLFKRLKHWGLSPGRGMLMQSNAAEISMCHACGVAHAPKSYYHRGSASASDQQRAQLEQLAELAPAGEGLTSARASGHLYGR